jgi:hypothetical protein
MSISSNDLSGTINSGFNSGGNTFQIGFILHTSNNLINQDTYNSNILYNYSSNNSNNLSYYIKNTSYSLTTSTSDNSNSSNFLFNYILNNSNSNINYTSNLSLTNSNNLANYTSNNSNYFSNLSFTNSNNLINYTSNNSNILNNKFNSINTDTIIQGSSNRFIINDIYNRNITFTNSLYSSNIITSNLSVIGDTTTLNTTIYQTEQLQVINDTTSTAMIIKQVNSNKNVAEFYYQNNQLGFLITSNGNIGIGSNINPLNKLDVLGNINTSALSINNVDVSTTISNNSNNLATYILNTSNKLSSNSGSSALNSGGTITGQLILSTTTGTNPLYITSTNATANNCINIKNNSTYNTYIGIGGTNFGGNYANNFFIESASSSIILNTNGRTSASTPNFIINPSGNVGIGTNSPNSLLSLGNTVNYKIISLYDNGLTNNFQFVGLGANNGLCFNNYGTGDAFQFRVGTSTTAANELMRINGDGSVCIGTSTATSSSTKLTIAGSSTLQPIVNITQNSAWDGANFALKTTGYTLLGGIRINGTDTNNTIYQTIANTSMGLALNPSNTSGNLTFTTFGSSGSIIFNTSGFNQRMAIDSGGTITTSTNIDCGGGIAITGSTTPYNPSSIAENPSLINTYIAFKGSGAGNDWAYLRQIGDNEAIKLALDFHDDANDARFCIRSIASAGNNPDVNYEVFTVDNGNVNCTGNITCSGSLGVGTNSTPPVKCYVNGDFAATGDITAFYSDIRLKNIHSNISNPLDIINKLNAFYYTPNELGKSLGIDKNKMEIGLSAQDVQNVLPELVSIAPFDMMLDDEGNIKSKSGNNYLTVSYQRLVPILIEGIKEQNKKIINLENELNKIKSILNI